MTDVVRRLAAADNDPQTGETWIGSGVVTNAAAGTTTDGRKLITVTIRGTSHTCTYLASYTPGVNHVVTFLKAGPSVFVLGRAAT